MSALTEQLRFNIYHAVCERDQQRRSECGKQHAFMVTACQRMWGTTKLFINHGNAERKQSAWEAVLGVFQGGSHLLR